MRPASRLIPVVLTLLLLDGCASGPAFDTRQVDRSLTPAVATAASRHATGKEVLWGGTILGVTNLAQNTLIEIQAYPLGYHARPQPDAAPLGRFTLDQRGFLDPAFYSIGRLLTVAGRITRIDTGKAMGSEQARPVVNARQMHLWPADKFHDGPGVRFGGEIGVGHGF
jgi:outer membrane lipoprotein